MTLIDEHEDNELGEDNEDIQLLSLSLYKHITKAEVGVIMNNCLSLSGIIEVIS
jgi:hypothetical protein